MYSKNYRKKSLPDVHLPSLIFSNGLSPIGVGPVAKVLSDSKLPPLKGLSPLKACRTNKSMTFSDNNWRHYIHYINNKICHYTVLSIS